MFFCDFTPLHFLRKKSPLSSYLSPGCSSFTFLHLCTCGLAERVGDQPACHPPTSPFSTDPDPHPPVTLPLRRESVSRELVCVPNPFGTSLLLRARNLRSSTRAQPRLLLGPVTTKNSRTNKHPARRRSEAPSPSQTKSCTRSNRGSRDPRSRRTSPPFAR